MKSTINTTDDYAYHTFVDTEFSCVFDNYKISGYTYNYHYGYNYNYHIFIRYGDKVYMNVKRVGEIVISYSELQQNKYWKYYYDLSLLLTNNKHLVIQDLKYINYDHIWSIDTNVFVSNGFRNQIEILPYYKDTCYLGINPYVIDNTKCTLQQDVNIFNRNYMSKYDTSKIMFDKKCVYYYNLAIDYYANMMEKELDELSKIIEDKKNILNLATLNDKHDMNSDVLTIIYNLLVSPEGNLKYKEIIDKMTDCKNKLELTISILDA